MKTAPAARPGPRRGGFALLMVLLVLAVASGGLAMLGVSMQRTRSVGAALRGERAWACAEAGMALGTEEVEARFATGADVPTLLASTTLLDLDRGPERLAVRVTDNDDADGDDAIDSDGRILLAASCSIERVASGVRAEGTVERGSAFRAATCGCGDQDASSAIETDSYDSLLGAYDPGSAGARGGVRGNGDVVLVGVVRGDVIATGNVSGTALVEGDVIAGGTVDTASLSILGDVQTGVVPAPSPCRCGAGIDLDTIIADAATANDNAALGSCQPYLLAAGTFAIGGTDSCTLPAGTYHFTSFTIADGARVDVEPTLNPANPAEAVEIVLAGDGPFEIAGAGIANASERSLNLRIFSDSTGTIALGGSAGFAGIVYAPEATVDQRTTHVHGAIFGALTTSLPTVEIHFDTNLLNRPDFLESWKPAAGSWRLTAG